MKKGDTTRARILEEAATQAAYRGLGAVSLNDVAEAIGMSKSGLFKHFQAKEAMQLAAVEATVARYVETVWRPLADMPPGPDKCAAIFEKVLDWTEFECGPGGCLIQQASVEFDDQPGPLRDYLHESARRWTRTMRRELAQLRDPPLAEDDALQAAFEFKGILMAFGEHVRLMDDGEARMRARRSYQSLVKRFTTQCC